MARKFVYGLAILIFMASGYITFLAVRGPVPKRILNEYVPHQNNGRGLPDKKVAERVVKRKEQSIGSVNGLEKETSSLQKKVGDSENILKVQQQPQSVVDEELARLKREKEAEQAQVPPQVVEELARVEQEKEAPRTKVANLDEHIKTLQKEPAQARQDETAARTVASKPSAEGENREEIVITLTGLFDSGQDIISLKSQDVIKQHAERIKAMPNYRISVEGHTDSEPVVDTGFNVKYSHNMGLSYWRAMSVAIRLMELGIDSRRITVTGYGKSRPVASNDTPEGRAKNRRVEIRLLRD